MTNDYLSLYLHSPFAQKDPAAILSLLFLFFGRILPIIAQAPFFGAKVLPHPVKVALGLSFFGIFFPQLVTVTQTPLEFNLDLVLLFMKELIVGTLMGFVITIPFMMVQNAGIMIDHQRGGASLMVNDPTIQNQSSPLGTFFNFVFIYIFFYVNGPYQILDIIGYSFEILPPDKVLSSGFFTVDSQIFVDIVLLLGKLMILSTQLAAPALIIILMTDFFLGIANRLAPQVQITFLGMPLKSLLGIAIIFFGWDLLVNQFLTESYNWTAFLKRMIDSFKPFVT